jgi:DNA-binding response OmpR family regulator
VRLLIAHGSQAAQEALAEAVQQGVEETLDIVTASEGSEALELLLQDDPPDLALVDWDLPAIEGPEMCRLVRDFHQGHDTWLAVLAAAEHTDTADAWRAGASACIPTPASPGALSDCIRDGLRKMRPAQVRPTVAAGPSLDAVVHPDDDVHPPAAGGPATLDAVRMTDGASDFYGFGGSGLRATAELDSGFAPEAAAERRAPDEQSSAARLKAVLSER